MVIPGITTITFIVMKRFIVIFSALCLLLSCSNPKPAEPGTTVIPTVLAINYSVVGYLPHDTNSFTEGLLVHNGQLFESTGHPPDNGLPQTRSLFGTVDIKTGEIDVKAEIDKIKYFGEGISFFNNKVYQLTLTTRVGFIYDASTFKKLGEFAFPNKEGWGLTTDGTNLIMSDGTGNLSYLDPVTLKTIRTLAVTNNGIAADSLNELEYIKGYVYANVWLTNSIVKIDTVTGKIVGMLDLGSLVFEARNKYPGSLELNGIAYDSIADKIYVTGKLWPNIYEIKFQH